MRPTIWIPKIQPKSGFAIAFLFFLGCMVYRDFASFAEIAMPSRQSPPLTDEQRTFFESKIRPVLAGKCYSCHSAQAKEVEGGLLLDNRQGVQKGGEDGPIIVPRNPDSSLLIQALRYGNKDLQMPPQDNGGKLPDAVIHDFETWVRMGAPDPRDGGGLITPSAKPWDTTEAKKWWAFQPLRPPTTPEVTDAGWAREELDRYVLAALDAKNIKPVADASKQVLIRRVYFDLIGLPPTPDEVDAFMRDDSPTAYQNVVDNLLRASAVRRALGPALAGCSALCRIDRQRFQCHVSKCMAISRLRYCFFQPGQTVQRVHSRTACRRSYACI